MCAAKDVYAGGDIVSFPYHHGAAGEMVNIGHWQLASYHGISSFVFLYTNRSKQIVLTCLKVITSYTGLAFSTIEI